MSKEPTHPFQCLSCSIRIALVERVGSDFTLELCPACECKERFDSIRRHIRRLAEKLRRKS